MEESCVGRKTESNLPLIFNKKTVDEFKIFDVVVVVVSAV